MLLFSFLLSPVFGVEIVNAKNADEDKAIKENTRVYDTYQSRLEEQNGIYIPNPFEKKQEVLDPLPQKEPRSMAMDCDNMEYNEETNELEAKGHVTIITKPDNVKITADRAVFDRASNIIKLYDNIIVYKDTGELKGDFMSVDLNSENILMNEPAGEFQNFKITAREGYAYANKIEAINGDIELVKKLEMTLQTNGFGSFYDKTIFPDDNVSFELKQKRSEPYRIKTKEIIITAGKDHDKINFKNAEISYKKFKLGVGKNIEIHTNKNQDFIEANIPEIGSLKGFGTFLALGPVLDAPCDSTLKIMPALVIKNNVGIGVLARHRSKRSILEAGWATSSKNLVVRGKYKLNDDISLEYGRHAYMSEWLFGENRPGYAAGLKYKKLWHNDDLNADYQQEITGGYVSDYAEKGQKKRNNGTVRFRWQARLVKNVFHLENKEQELFFDGYIAAHAAASVYGTGEVVGLVGVGPSLASRVKFWGSRIWFNMNGVHGDSPYYFDKYRYGKITLGIDENIRFGKYLAIGYRGTFTPLKDNWKNDFITENKFYAMTGPSDIKLALAYDAIRSSLNLDMKFLIGSDNAKVKYDKLIVNDPQSIGVKRDIWEDWKLRRIKVPEAI